MSTSAAFDGLPELRRLPVAGTRNFRDIGGYVTADGIHQTRWHRLYRSDHLAKTALDAEACAYLRDTLHVACTIDVRSTEERQVTPYAIPGVVTYRLSMLAGEEIIKVIRDVPELTEQLVEALMSGVCTKLVAEFQVELGRFFKLLVERGTEHPGEAIVYHCKAGKDRTGVCTALLLLVLGVPAETVYEDYLLTNSFYEAPPISTIKGYLKIAEVEDGAISALFEARRTYLESAVRWILDQYSSIEAYMREALGLTLDDLETLRTAFLEPCAAHPVAPAEPS